MMFRLRFLRSTSTAASVPVEREPASPRFSSLSGAGWRWLVRLNRRIEDCWLGDLLGVISLFVTLGILLVIGWAVQ